MPKPKAQAVGVNVFRGADHVLTAAVTKRKPRGFARRDDFLGGLADGTGAFARLDVDEGVHRIL